MVALHPHFIAGAGVEVTLWCEKSTGFCSIQHIALLRKSNELLLQLLLDLQGATRAKEVVLAGNALRQKRDDLIAKVTS